MTTAILQSMAQNNVTKIICDVIFYLHNKILLHRRTIFPNKICYRAVQSLKGRQAYS